jgi:hypothetical protein
MGMPVFWQGDHYLMQMRKAKEDYENSLSLEYKRWRSFKWHVQTKGAYYLVVGTIGFGVYINQIDIILISLMVANINWNINKRAEHESMHIL